MGEVVKSQKFLSRRSACHRGFESVVLLGQLRQRTLTTYMPGQGNCSLVTGFRKSVLDKAGKTPIIDISIIDISMGDD